MPTRGTMGPKVEIFLQTFFGNGPIGVSNWQLLPGFLSGNLRSWELNAAKNKLPALLSLPLSASQHFSCWKMRHCFPRELQLKWCAYVCNWRKCCNVIWADLVQMLWFCIFCCYKLIWIAEFLVKKPQTGLTTIFMGDLYAFHDWYIVANSATVRSTLGLHVIYCMFLAVLNVKCKSW